MITSPKHLSSITTNCCGFMPAYAYYGAPGSGKGTQGLLVAERERFMHLSAGDLLRRKIKEGDPAEKVWAHLRQNDLSNHLFRDYEEIVDDVYHAWRAFSQQYKFIQSLTHCSWINGHF